MEEALADLVLAPFREIISQGNIAIDNAVRDRNDGMIKAAQGLVREGGKALKKIEPLCLKYYNEYGSAFVDALKDDDEISSLTEGLSNLLYDFEEYVDSENFEAEKFTELQELSRKAVLRISHIIPRMKLAPPPADRHDLESVSSMAAESTAAVVRRPSEGVLPQCREPLPYPEDTEPEVKYATMPYPPSPSPDYDPRRADSSSAFHMRPVREEEPAPPPPPFLDPWSHGFQNPSEELDQRRDTILSSDSALGSSNNSDCNASPMNAGHAKPPQHSSAVPPRSPNRTSTVGQQPEPAVGLASPGGGRISISPIPPRPYDPRSSIGSSTNASERSSVSDPRRECHLGFDLVASPISPMNRTSGYSDFQPQIQGQGQSPHVPPLFARPGASVPVSPQNDDPEPVVFPTLNVPDGLIPVEVAGPAPESSPPDLEAQLGGCSMDLHSSFNHFKSFCEGAMEIRRGGLGIRHIKKQGLAIGTIEVAKCKACAYELEWKAVERDVKNEGKYSKATCLRHLRVRNFKSAGIGFRLRVLSKSHIETKNVGDQIYGCPFCVQLQQTTHPNDATIFFSQRQLFAHLARHPRPLPYVPGLAVVEADEVPAPSANNYDLHFPRPPRAAHLAGLMRELTALPTATAAQTCRPTPTFALRRPEDGGGGGGGGGGSAKKVLCFAAGARILGVEFPDRYQGEWCLGWADHEYGLLPADAIRLDPPRRRDVRWGQGAGAGGNSSTMRAVARWKFSMKDGKDRSGDGAEDWLSFSKGEVITNIVCELSIYSVRSLLRSSAEEPSAERRSSVDAGPHQEHWCWWGTNSKGKSGMFPRSHIEPGTLMEAASKSGRASSISKTERMGLLSKLSIQYLRNGSFGGGASAGGSTSPRTPIH